MNIYAERFIKARRADLVGINPGRSGRIRGVMIHSTRSGRKDNDDGPGTENWAMHPENGGAFQDAIIWGDGTRIICTRFERDEQPLWCAGWGGDGTWNAQDYYLMVEFSQGTIDSAFTRASIDSGAQLVGRWARLYGFEIIRIPNLHQTAGTPAPQGICTHDGSANGRKLGKSDPGPLFPWEEFIRRAVAYRDGRDPDAPKEEPMTNNERAILQIAGGPYERMAEAYDHLVVANLLHYEDPTQPPPLAGNDTNDTATVKRFALVSLAASNPDAAVAALAR